MKYPICIDGKIAYPVEDCDGISGYYNLIEILKKPTHEEHDEYIHWLKHHSKKYYPYKSDELELQKVEFSNPKIRLRKAFRNR